LLSNSGTWVQNLTVPYVVFQLTHSSTWVGIAAFSQLAPMAMMSPLGGTIADRLDRRRVLLVTQVAMGVGAIMMGGAWVTGVASVPVIIGLVAVGGVITGINAPAWQAFVSELVPRDALLNAVTLNSAQFNAARAFGPALGGLVLVTLGPGPAFFINAASYGAVLVALALIATPKRPPVSTPRPPILSDARATIGYVQDRRGMLACYVAVVALGLFGQPIFSLVIVFAEEVFQVGGLRYGLLSAALGIGSVIAAPVVAGPGSGVKLVGDITYIRTWEGWVYLATVIDCFSKMVVGFAMADHMRTGLVTDALQAAIDAGGIQSNAIFHSDHGAQYTSEEFKAFLASNDMVGSMGKTGVCWDNAMAESFFASLKNEFVYRTVFPTRRKAVSGIAHWIEIWYNRSRLHSGIGYRTPVEVHDSYRDEARAA
jgi:transposase InsO family protein